MSVTTGGGSKEVRLPQSTAVQLTCPSPDCTRSAIRYRSFQIAINSTAHGISSSVSLKPQRHLFSFAIQSPKYQSGGNLADDILKRREEGSGNIKCRMKYPYPGTNTDAFEAPFGIPCLGMFETTRYPPSSLDLVSPIITRYLLK